MAGSVVSMGLRYATVTGVARDDLNDGGAWLYARELQFDGELTDEQRAALLDIAERCPVHRTLHSTLIIATTDAASRGTGRSPAPR